MTRRADSDALYSRAAAAGLTVRGQALGRATHTVSLEGPAVPELTDQELKTVAGLNPARHFGASVRRWDGEPTVATVDLHLD